MLREAEAETLMREYLVANGFIVENRRGIHGVDIKASRNGRTHFFEVEGNTKPDGSPLSTSQKYTHLLRAIGQLCLRLNDNFEATLALAIPDDKYYRMKVAELQRGLQRLCVTVYYVNENGEIEEVCCMRDDIE